MTNELFFEAPEWCTLDCSYPFYMNVIRAPGVKRTVAKCYDRHKDASGYTWWWCEGHVTPEGAECWSHYTANGTSQWGLVASSE